MAFIYIHYKKYDAQGNVIGGIASIRKTVYDNGRKHHNRQVTIERLGEVIYLSDDKKSGIFNSPIRGLVSYDVQTEEFSSIDKDDSRIKGRDIIISPTWS